MKLLVLFLGLITLCRDSAFAQSPTIDSMIVRSAGSDLWLYGNFGPIQGTVSLEGTYLPIQIWTPDHIICTLAPSASGRVIVKSQMTSSAPRILESLWIVVERLWGGGMAHDGISGSIDATTEDTLFFAFDASNTLKFAAEGYQRKNRWKYTGQSNVGYTLQHGPKMGNYSAVGAGSLSAPLSLIIHRDTIRLGIPEDSGNYQYSYFYVTVDSMNREADGPTQTGTSRVTFPETVLQLQLFDTTVKSSIIIGPNQLQFGDPAAANFFSWVQFGNQMGSNSGSSARVRDYHIGYPLSQSSVSLTESANSELKIYPNPARERIEVSGTEDDIHLYDILGREVAVQSEEASHATPSRMETTLDVSRLESGIYILRLGGHSTMVEVK